MTMNKFATALATLALLTTTACVADSDCVDDECFDEETEEVADVDAPEAETAAAQKLCIKLYDKYGNYIRTYCIEAGSGSGQK